jgi:predicted enzyme related to lactoylglutathione lyase
MALRTSYTPGTFCWTDLTTPDQAAAKAFYSALFGWEAFDAPIGDGVVYSMMSIGGQQVGAISPQPQQQADAGAPPAWNSYVSVESADAALDRARELGATVHADAFDVMDAGRMGVIKDPQGAYVLVWQPGSNRGAGVVNAHGALSWNELASPDLDASSSFYGDLFGWTIEPIEGAPTPYRTIKTAAGNYNGGIAPLMPPGTPPHWLVYFGTDDIETSVATAKEHGANVLVGPMDIGMGTIAVLTDPQGAVFALFAGTFED